jgi:hypothetical protein
MKRFLFLLSIAVLGFSADTGLACTCAPSPSAAHELKRATAVFSGKVVKVEKHNEAAGIFARVEAVFKVSRVWKGVENETVSVFTSSMSTACGYRFQKGLTYLVYAYGNEDGKLATSICARTARFEDWHEDFEELGPGNIITKSEEFTNEIQEVARQFAQRLKETREFRPEVKELFVERFSECHLRAELERNENGVFSQISASIPPGIIREARREELRNYLIAQLNFFHLETLYRMSTRSLEGKWHDSFYAPEEDYPPGVYKLLMKNPVIAATAATKNNNRVTISSSVQNVQELRSVLSTVEDALSAMGEYFKAHPPEETEPYKKNMERIGNDKNNSKFWEVSFQELSDKQLKEGKRCLGFSPRSISVVKVPPFYQLIIFQSGKQFRIGSLLCTEPPCVD